MKKALPLLLSALSSTAMSQIQGDVYVCPGNTYTYTADIPGAVSYAWTFPEWWYDVSGQGTASVTVTSNYNPGDVCVMGYDEMALPIGPYCLSTQAGGGGGGLDLVPSSYFGCNSVDVTFSMVPNGTGGGCEPCGGTPHPNIGYALYSDPYFPNAQFVAFVDGNPMTVFPPGITVTAFLVDYTNGLNWPNAILISGGCGGSGTATVGVTVVPIPDPVFVQDPEAVCEGDTVTVTEIYTPGTGNWEEIVDMTVLQNGNPLVAVVTGPNASGEYQGLMAGCPLPTATHGIHYCVATGVAVPVTAALRFVGEHRYALPPAVHGPVKVMNAAGEEVLRSHAREVDLGSQATGIYIIQAVMTDGSTLRWKVMR